MERIWHNHKPTKTRPFTSTDRLGKGARKATKILQGKSFSTDMTSIEVWQTDVVKEKSHLLFATSQVGENLYVKKKVPWSTETKIECFGLNAET